MYKCAACKEQFESTWTDAAARAEAERTAEGSRRLMQRAQERERGQKL